MEAAQALMLLGVKGLEIQELVLELTSSKSKPPSPLIHENFFKPLASYTMHIYLCFTYTVGAARII